MSLDVCRFERQADWLQWRAQHSAQLADEGVENTRLLAALGPPGMHGTCVLCNAQRWFRCPGHSQGAAISLRESLLCATCQANARQRAVAQVLFDSIDTARSDVYLTEQASAFYLHLGPRCRRLAGSEYVTSWRQRLRLSSWLARMGKYEWVRREDITRLSFPDCSLDAVVSLDVLEHVPDFRRALSEFARVLRPGGNLLLTVPFYSDQAYNVALAHIDADSSIEYLQPPEFHGDPLSGGVLCFHHFGWALLAEMEKAGFAHAEAVRVRDPAKGLPEAQWVLYATR